MGNLFRNMMDIRLTYHIRQEIDENFSKFKIEVHTDYLIDSLKNKIFETVKKIDNKIFSDIDATDLMLWKVEIHDDEFSKLELKNEDTKRIKKLQRIVSEYWKEQPSTEFIYVIVDSPSLLYKREIAELQEGIRTLQMQDAKNRCNGCGSDSMSVYFSGNLENVSRLTIEEWLHSKLYVFTHVIKVLHNRYGIVHFDTLEDASLFYYGMRGKQLGPSNIMINFSAAYQFGTRKEVSYPLVKIPNSTTMPVTPPVPVIEIDLTEDEGMAPKRQKMTNEASDEKITLNIGGIKYETLQSTLTSHPDTLLGSMFQQNKEIINHQTDRKEYFFDRDGKVFRYILQYYRNNKIYWPVNQEISKEELLDELTFFQIPNTDED
ncbi:hypothetical protein RhiirB3_424213 [Rhizophagus irregularis]|nr:hypothetical protein RhiirB3_424213 [Rhizophagus irregularis]